MSESGKQPGVAEIWYGALTVGAVAAMAVWALRLLFPQKVHLGGVPKVAVVGAAVAMVVALGAIFRSAAVGVAAALPFGALVLFEIVDPGPASRAVVATFVAFAVVSLVVAHQWSNHTMRVVVTLLAIVGALLVLRSGRAELDNVRLRHAREKAVSLRGQVAELSAAATKKTQELPSQAQKAYDAAHKELADSVGGDGRDLPRPGGCDTPALGLVDIRLCTLSPILEAVLRKVGHPPAPNLSDATDALDTLRVADTLSEGDRVRIGAFAAAADAIAAALVRPPRTDLTLSTATTSVELLCTTSHGTLGALPSGCPPGSTTTKIDDGPRALDVATAQAQRDVAAARVAIDGTADDTKELADADVVLATAMTNRTDPAPGNSLATT